MLWFSCMSGATQDSQQQILLRTLPVSRRMGQKKPRTAQSLFHNCDGVSCLRASQFQERGSRLWFSAHDKACSIKALHWSQPPGKPRGPRLHPACSGGLCIPKSTSWWEVAGRLRHSVLWGVSISGALRWLCWLRMCAKSAVRTKRRVCWGHGKRGNGSSMLGKGGRGGEGGGLFLAGNLHVLFIKTKQFLLPSKIPACQHSAQLLCQGSAHAGWGREGRGSGGGCHV